MTSARAEWAGVGAALIFHVALIAALSLSLARLDPIQNRRRCRLTWSTKLPSNPLRRKRLHSNPARRHKRSSRLSRPISPCRRARPANSARGTATHHHAYPALAATAEDGRSPSHNRALSPSRRKGRHPNPRSGKARAARRMGDDFLSDAGRRLSPRAGASKPAAPTYNATRARKHRLGQIAAQAQRCANREPYIGEGADKVRLTVNLQFARSGRLSRPPRVTGMSGDSGLRAKYGECSKTRCAAFSRLRAIRLPPDLYDTDNGG